MFKITLEGRECFEANKTYEYNPNSNGRKRVLCIGTKPIISLYNVTKPIC